MTIALYRATSRSAFPRAALMALACGFALAGCVGGGGGGGSSGGSGSSSSGPDGEPLRASGDAYALSLSWTPAEARENGDYLDGVTEIDGHEIVYRREGETSWSGSHFEDWDLYGTTIEGLEPGTYYFAARTRDTDGRWSDYSEELLVEVN